MPTISRLETQQRNPERVNLYADGAFVAGLSASIVLSRGLHPGMELSEEGLLELTSDEEFLRAYGAALNFLSFRPRSEREVSDYLRRKGVDDAVGERVIARLGAVDLVNDAEFARYWVENRQAHRPKGSRALQMELRQKGVAGDLIEVALEDVQDQDAAAYAVARDKARSYAKDDEREFFRKMVGFLQRRGFEFSVAADAARKAHAELHEDDYSS